MGPGHYSTDWGFAGQTSTLVLPLAALGLTVGVRLLSRVRNGVDVPFLARLAPYMPFAIRLHLAVSLIGLLSLGFYLSPARDPQADVAGIPLGAVMALVAIAMVVGWPTRWAAWLSSPPARSACRSPRPGGASSRCGWRPAWRSSSPPSPKSSSAPTSPDAVVLRQHRARRPPADLRRHAGDPRLGLAPQLRPAVSTVVPCPVVGGALGNVRSRTGPPGARGPLSVVARWEALRRSATNFVGLAVEDLPRQHLSHELPPWRREQLSAGNVTYRDWANAAPARRHGQARVGLPRG